jgi:hypothetical protein
MNWRACGRRVAHIGALTSVFGTLLKKRPTRAASAHWRLADILANILHFGPVPKRTYSAISRVRTIY